MDNLFYCRECGRPYPVPPGKLQQFCPECRHKRHSLTGKLHGGDWRKRQLQTAKQAQNASTN